MPQSTIRFISFPRTEPPPHFVSRIIEAFRRHETSIGTMVRGTQLKSDEVLRILEPDLTMMGFAVERGKSADLIVERPVFFGEDGIPTLRFEVDAYHSEWKCGLEIEASRGIRGGAFYRDLVQAMVMVGVDHLCVALQNRLEYGKGSVSKDFPVAVNTAQAIYGHSRVSLPFGLTVIGY
jgi:hypothetical protein